MVRRVPILSDENQIREFVSARMTAGTAGDVDAAARAGHALKVPGRPGDRGVIACDANAPAPAQEPPR